MPVAKNASPAKSTVRKPAAARAKAKKPADSPRPVAAAAKTDALSQRVRTLIRLLKKTYPDPRCELDFRNPYEALVATILSAQCTDKKVNAVTPALFARFPAPAALGQAQPAEVEALIHALGLFRNKAKNIIAAARMIGERFGGAVPQTLAEIAELPGAGRKTANCVLINAYGQPGIMADTHCIRLSNRLGLADTDDATKIEFRLKELIPVREQAAFSHRIILHGRRVCHARNPQCDGCPLRPVCPFPAQ